MFNKKLIKKNTIYDIDIEYYECKTKFNIIKLISNLFNKYTIENWFEIHINFNKYTDNNIIMTFNSIYDYRKADIKLESLIKEFKYKIHDINKYPYDDKEMNNMIKYNIIYYFENKIKKLFNEYIINEVVNYE